MSDVEEQIKRWRSSLVGSETLGHWDINELESHLREEISHLQKLGLSEAEAFLVARQRLGETAALEGEFAKVHGPRRSLLRLSWMALGALLYVLAGYVANGFSQGAVLAATLFGVQGYTLGILGVALKATAIISFFVLAWMFCRQWDWTEPVRRLQAISVPRLVLLLAALLLLDGALIGSQLLYRVVTARSLSPVDFGRVAIVFGYARLAWTILAPILAAILVIGLRICAHRYRDGASCLQ